MEAKEEKALIGIDFKRCASDVHHYKLYRFKISGDVVVHVILSLNITDIACVDS
jgi:hypothetical protein